MLRHTFQWIVMFSLLVASFGCSENCGLIRIAGTVTCGGKQPPATGSMKFLPEPGQADMQEGSARFDKDGTFLKSNVSKLGF